MTNTSFSSLFLALSVVACTATRPAPTPPSTPNATPPAEWAVLAGPHATLEAACTGCQLSPIQPLSGADFVAVAQGSRGFDSFVALQTARGWYLEQRDAMAPMESHHEPRSLYYDIERTRIADGAVVRMVDSSQVFYPGQGNAGTSHTNWYERTCRVFGDRVACSKPVSIATRHCKRDSVGNGETNEQCTGNEPGL